MLYGLLLSFLAAIGCSDDTSAPADAARDHDGSDDAGLDARKGDAAPLNKPVETTFGPVKGLVAGGVHAFLGIPYAKPPVGALRWRPPQAPTPWKAIRDANKHGPSCPPITLSGKKPKGVSDEDCLYLSVWTPAQRATDKRLPVMVWIHGGGFISGSASSALYDGKKLAAFGNVIVSMNYRLGPLGAFAHPKLSQGEGNFNLLDQQAALTWVKNNIAAFGGDPNNVTLFGESAGAISVCLHLVAPGSKGLFHRAIMQSGTCYGPALTRTQAEAQGLELAKKLGCDTAKDPIACLRAKTPTDLGNALPIPKALFVGDGATWAPFVDGASLTEPPKASVTAKKMQKVPVILGANKNEGTLFVALAKMEKMTEAEYKSTVGQLAAKLGFKTADALAKYPAASFSSPAEAMAEMLGDAAFVCPARRVARGLSENGSKTFLYHFTHAPIFFSIFPFYRATHSAEIPFVFGNYPLGIKFPTREAALNKSMAAYWTRFAEKGDPNSAKAASWPEYQKASDEHMVLDLALSKNSGLKKKLCDFWDAATKIP